MLLNLLSNAIPYGGSPGEVRVTTNVSDGCVAIAVADDDGGIPDVMIERLFVPFDRLGADSSREIGAGLGLVLARGLVEAMGGRRDVASTVGVGTTVSAHLRHGACA